MDSAPIGLYFNTEYKEIADINKPGKESKLNG